MRMHRQKIHAIPKNPAPGRENGVSFLLIPRSRNRPIQPLEISGDFWRSLEISGDLWRFPEIFGVKAGSPQLGLKKRKTDMRGFSRFLKCVYSPSHDMGPDTTSMIFLLIDLHGSSAIPNGPEWYIERWGTYIL